MMLERYKFTVDETYQLFGFISVGPNGNVQKVIRYTLQHVNSATYLNLGFGDWNNKTKRIDDLAITNNLDKKKILATVAATVLAFTKRFPDMAIFATGSTPSRTRLYQMAIVSHWNDIDQLLYVYGWKNKKWEVFRKGVSYDAFLVCRRKFNFIS